MNAVTALRAQVERNLSLRQPERAAMARGLTGAIALMVAVALILQVGLTMAPEGPTFWQTLWGMARFFTVLTNTAIGVVCLLVAVGFRPGRQVQAALFLAIAAVAIVYHTLLAHLIDVSGLAAALDALFHTVIPVAYGLYWLCFAPKTGLRAAHVPLWLSFPVAYCLYAVLRGQLDGVYPYPFLDVAARGWGGVALAATGLLLAFWLAGLAIVALADRLTRPRV